MKPLPILTLLAIILIIAWNYVVNALPLFGVTTGEISGNYPTLITPAGYAFSIWGVIYLGLLAFGIYQVLPAQTDVVANPDLWEKFRIILLINLLANALWLVAFHDQVIWATLLLMIAILYSLVHLFLIVQQLEVPVWVNWTFQIYFGWITVATVVNVSLFIYDLNILPNDSLAWLIAILVIAMGIGLGVMWIFKAYAYLAVLIWAFAAIGVKLNQTAATENYIWWPWGLAAVMAVMILFRVIRS